MGVYGMEGVLLQDGWGEGCAFTGVLKNKVFRKRCAFTGRKVCVYRSVKKRLSGKSPCRGDERWVYTGKPKSQKSEKVGFLLLILPTFLDRLP